MSSPSLWWELGIAQRDIENVRVTLKGTGQDRQLVLSSFVSELSLHSVFVFLGDSENKNKYKQPKNPTWQV